MVVVHERQELPLIVWVGMTSGYDRAFYSGKHKRHGMNVQVLADPAGRLVWASPALPGARHDLGAAREHGLIDGLNAAGVRVVADTAYQGGGPAIRVPQRRRRVDPGHRPLPPAVPGAEGSQRRPRPPAWSGRTGERPTQVLEGPPPDPQLPQPSNQPRQGRDGADPDQLRSSWKGLTVGWRRGRPPESARGTSTRRHLALQAPMRTLWHMNPCLAQGCGEFVSESPLGHTRWPHMAIVADPPNSDGSYARRCPARGTARRAGRGGRVRSSL